MNESLVKFGRRVLKAEGLNDVSIMIYPRGASGRPHGEGFWYNDENEIRIGPDASKATMLHEITHAKFRKTVNHCDKEFIEVEEDLMKKYLPDARPIGCYRVSYEIRKIDEEWQKKVAELKRRIEVYKRITWRDMHDVTKSREVNDAKYMAYEQVYESLNELFGEVKE